MSVSSLLSSSFVDKLARPLVAELASPSAPLSQPQLDVFGKCHPVKT